MNARGVLDKITRCHGCGQWRYDLDNNPCTVCIQLQEQRR